MTDLIRLDALPYHENKPLPFSDCGCVDKYRSLTRLFEETKNMREAKGSSFFDSLAGRINALPQILDAATTGKEVGPEKIQEATSGKIGQACTHFQEAAGRLEGELKAERHRAFEVRKAYLDLDLVEWELHVRHVFGDGPSPGDAQRESERIQQRIAQLRSQ